MPVQLRLLDETRSRRLWVWPQLPEQVRRELVELLARLLLECVQDIPRKVEGKDESR
jgi:hypothetical protein